MLRHFLRWFIPIVGILLVGIVKYARFALPVLAVLAGYLYYKSLPPSPYSSPEEEKAWNAVLGHGKWKSYTEKVNATAAARAQAAAASLKREQERKALFDAATAQKMTMVFDMAFSFMDERPYLREHPNSMKADFLLLCSPRMVSALQANTPERERLEAFHNRVVEEVAKDVATPQGWSNRAIRQRRWVVVFADPYARSLPNPTYESVGAPPVGNQACIKQTGVNSSLALNRYYFKINGAP